MRGLKEIISKVLVGIASVIVVVVLVIIIAGLMQVLSLGMDWVFNNNVTPEFVETVKLIGFFVGVCALASEFRELIRY